VVTGAGAGIGRAHALELARDGVAVVVNDIADPTRVVEEIRAAGGRALPSTHDISDFDQAADLVESTVAELGDLHVVINNAGILRDRMVTGMSVEEWDAVIAVHLRGTFATTRHAAAYWRTRSKAGTPTDAPRIVNTSSPSGLFGNVGQSNYGAAKAGIAAFTVIVADELARLGVGVNAIAPTALTAMTDGLDAYVAQVNADSERRGFDVGAPENIAPLVAWLGSPRCRFTGRVLTVKGGEISVAETWVKGPRAVKEGPWELAELDDLVPALVERARPNSSMYGDPRR